MNDSKWWEYYAVRYFVGTIVGAGLIAFLNQRAGSPFESMLSSLNEFKDASFKDVTLFAALGFAFCYVASAPILTVHSTREHLRLTRLIANPLRTILVLAVSLGSGNLLAFQFLSGPPAFVLATVVGLQLFLLLCALATRGNDIEALYIALSNARALGKGDRPKIQVQEYVESYRHLREHGNAFFILVMEAALAFVMLNLPSASCAVPVLLSWIFPASVVWLIGTVLESRLAHKSLFP